MATLRKLALMALWLSFAAGNGFAASGETRAFTAAEEKFHDQIWWLAESDFGAFIDKFPKSELRPQALLNQAIARYHQTNSIGAMDLLRANLDRAGVLADEYQFWIAEAYFQKADFASAAAAYAELGRRYAVSKRRLEAFVGEAASRSRMNDWTGVVALLGNPAGEFVRTVQGAVTNGLVVRGYLLLGEAQLALKDYPGVEKALAPVRGQKLAADLGWRVERLNYDAQFVGGRFTEALTTSSNLVSLAAGRTELLSESLAMQAAVLEQLGRPEQARAAYELNLAPGTRADRQRQALLKLTELALTQGNLAEATNRLVKFLNLSSNEPAADVALLTLGEIHLRSYVASSVTNRVAAGTPVTNELDIALGHFDRLVTTFTNSGFVGKAELDRGWCFWLRTNQLAECASAFERAAQRLPDSEDRIVAQFKLGDVLYLQKDYARSLERYRQAAEGLPRWTRARDALGGELYFQILRVSIDLTNAPSANEAVEQILKLQPGSALAESALLLMGQGIADAGDPASSRVAFEKFLSLSPNSPRRAEVELRIGRAREQQGDWAGAIAGYEQWVGRFATNALRPRAEFQLAWANWQAGRETNAYSTFTNFVTLYPSNELAPQAQWWVADYFWRQGKYTEAEINYKILFQNWKDSEFAYQARLKAGQAALGEFRYDDARNHFTNLTSDLKLIERAPELWSQAVFAYGDTLMAKASEDKTNQLANYAEAIRVFGQIQQRYSSTSNAIAVLAWGEVAKCWRQMPGGSSNAIFAFSQVVTSSVVNISARSEAQVGLAGVYADQAQQATGEPQQNLLREAVHQLTAIIYRENVTSAAEASDAFWVKRAGLDAGPLLEKLGDWKAAEQLYTRLQGLLPPLRATFQRKIEQLRERQQAAEKKPTQI